MPKQHRVDAVVDELADWMDATTAHLVDGLHDGDRAPLAAPVSRADTLAYYGERLFPGGVRDEAAIADFVARRGEPAYARLVLEVGRARRRQLDATPPPRPGDGAADLGG